MTESNNTDYAQSNDSLGNTDNTNKIMGPKVEVCASQKMMIVI